MSSCHAEAVALFNVDYPSAAGLSSFWRRPEWYLQYERQDQGSQIEHKYYRTRKNSGLTASIRRIELQSSRRICFKRTHHGALLFCDTDQTAVEPVIAIVHTE